MQRRRVLSFSLAPLLTPLLKACSTMNTHTAPPSIPALDAELQALVDDRDHPLLAASALVLRGGEVVYARQFGLAHVGDATHPALPASADTLWRVASISKLIVALGVLRLVEAGTLALDEDVSRWLGWPLRHPQYPSQPITLRLLLSHRSGLSDGGERYFFDGHARLQDVLTPDAPLYADGLNWRRDNPPGGAFEYVNLNSGVVATVMERATGQRFDRLMQQLVLQPLGLRGGFNPADFAPADQAHIATLYRKRRTVNGQEVWNPQGPWVVQADDFRHQPPAPPDGAADYVIGSNGTLFGPQGRLRTSVASLGVVLQMLLAEGRHKGQAFLQPATVRLLASAQWQRQGPPPAHGENVGACAWGLGAQRFTDTCAAGHGDRLDEDGRLQGFGHTGDAYGLMGLLALDPLRRHGVVIVLAGPGVDPATFPSRWSALYRWQEIATTAVMRHALPG